MDCVFDRSRQIPVGFVGKRQGIDLGLLDRVGQASSKTAFDLGSVSKAFADAAAAGGTLALVQNGDMIELDVAKRHLELLVPEEELAKRRAEFEKNGGYKVPPSQTPWQEIFRKEVGQLAEGMVLKGATKFQRVAKTMGLPRDNH